MEMFQLDIVLLSRRVRMEERPGRTVGGLFLKNSFIHKSNRNFIFDGRSLNGSLGVLCTPNAELPAVLEKRVWKSLKCF